MSKSELSERQRREIKYHQDHAAVVAQNNEKISYDVITSPKRRMHNAYWHFYTLLLKESLNDKRVLIVGCGGGLDALRIAKMGASVYAFDLSPDMLELARSSAESEGFQIHFSKMPAEHLSYEDNFFDYIVAVDILHHVDIPESMNEIVRVSKSGCKFFIDEIYSHSWTDRIRKSRLVEGYLYPLMRKWIYQNEKPYITEDERKLSEHDIRKISDPFSRILYRRYFNFIVTRLIPDKFDRASKLDYSVVGILGALGKYVGGRIILVGEITKSQ